MILTNEELLLVSAHIGLLLNDFLNDADNSTSIDYSFKIKDLDIEFEINLTKITTLNCGEERK